tara:strand:+ start:13210 stop:13371 length:162 start_codon:yes stop_codon:yes gene_type:complete
MKHNVTYIYDQGVVTFSVEGNSEIEVIQAAHKVLDPMSIDQLGPFITVEVEEA